MILPGAHVLAGSAEHPKQKSKSRENARCKPAPTQLDRMTPTPSCQRSYEWVLIVIGPLGSLDR
jgi:hypothetical protein